MYTLYPYQDNAISQLSEGFTYHLRQLLVMPTGSGKTVVFSEIIRRAISRSKVVLVLTDRKELHKQSVGATKRLGLTCCEINDKNKTLIPDAKLFIGMVETVARRIESIRNLKFDLIIIDEAHKGNFFKILDVFDTTRTLGCTATPINKRLHLYYTNLIQPIDTPELITESFLSPCKAFQMVDDFSDLEIKGNEYTDESLYRHYHKAKLYAGLLQEYKKHLYLKKTIVFCVNVKHTEETYNLFRSNGLPVYYVHSEMPDDKRDEQIKKFEVDPTGIMINCGILTTGYDHPPIIGVIVYRKTMSLALWIQMHRGSRIYRDKAHFICLDFGKNHEEHGLWSQPRQWTLTPPKKNKKLGAAPIKKCIECEAIIPASATRCEFCGHEYTKEEMKLKDGIMKEVVPHDLQGHRMSQLAVDQLAKLQQSKRYKSGFIWRVVRSKGEESIRAYAAKMGYKRGWIERQIDEMDNSQFKDVVIC